MYGRNGWACKQCPILELRLPVHESFEPALATCLVTQNFARSSLDPPTNTGLLSSTAASNKTSQNNKNMHIRQLSDYSASAMDGSLQHVYFFLHSDNILNDIKRRDSATTSSALDSTAYKVPPFDSKERAAMSQRTAATRDASESSSDDSSGNSRYVFDGAGRQAVAYTGTSHSRHAHRHALQPMQNIIFKARAMPGP